MSRVLVVQHEPECPPDLLGGWLAEAGHELVECFAGAGEDLPDLAGFGGLVVLGGHMGANDDAVCPWLPPVKALLRDAVQRETPTLGICLGAQLLAVACGGAVEVGAPGIEAGVVAVGWRAEAASDPLVGGLPDGFPGPSMHLDAVTRLPEGAVWLGETAQYPHQAFRVGPRAWGVQFHPEASLRTFRYWARIHDDEWAGWGLDGDAVVAELADREDEVGEAGRELAGRFSGLLG